MNIPIQFEKISFSGFIKSFRSFESIPDYFQARLIDIYQRAFALPPYQENFSNSEVTEWFQHLSGLEKSCFIVLGYGRELFGLAIGFRKEKDVFWIEELAVDPDFQHNGMGRLLLMQIVNEGLNKGANTVQLRTTASNKKSRNLYESIGFNLSQKSVLVSHLRTDGTMNLDKRVYYGYPQINYARAMQQPFIQRIAVMYPGGNTTALVLDQDPSIHSRNRTTLNEKIINSYPQFHIEQCGFVLPPSDDSNGALARLEMFGGEFCANAARSTIALLTENTISEGLLEVSGTNQLLHWHNNGADIAVQMPLPLYSELTEHTEDGVLVRLDGITHLVVLDKGVAPIGDAFTQYADKLMQKYDLKSLVAAGISWYDSSTNQATFRVYVQAVNTLFDETACGSGTCAIGMALAAAQNTAALSMDIIQPSGELISFTLADGKAYISGPVSVLYDGELSL